MFGLAALRMSLNASLIDFRGWFGSAISLIGANVIYTDGLRMREMRLRIENETL